MSAELILKKLRTFLLGFSIFIFIGTVFELSFLHHTRETIQFTPFILVAFGIILALLMLIKPSPKMVKYVRVGMIIVLLGGIFGMIVHIWGNLEPFIEGGQSATFGQLAQNAFGGKNPLLAPGILSLAALVALAALYKHPGTK